MDLIALFYGDKEPLSVPNFWHTGKTDVQDTQWLQRTKFELDVTTNTN